MAASPCREDRQAISPAATAWTSAGGVSPTPAGPGLSAGPSSTNRHAAFPSTCGPHANTYEPAHPRDAYRWFTSWQEADGDASGLLNNAVRHRAADGADQEKPAEALGLIF